MSETILPTAVEAEVPGAAPGKALSEGARRALLEASERRAAIDAAIASAASVGEEGGPVGLEPTRYGDWERKGRCVDF